MNSILKGVCFNEKHLSSKWYTGEGLSIITKGQWLISNILVARFLVSICELNYKQETHLIRDLYNELCREAKRFISKNIDSAGSTPGILSGLKQLQKLADEEEGVNIIQVLHFLHLEDLEDNRLPVDMPISFVVPFLLEIGGVAPDSFVPTQEVAHPNVTLVKYKEDEDSDLNIALLVDSWQRYSSYSFAWSPGANLPPKKSILPSAAIMLLKSKDFRTLHSDTVSMVAFWASWNIDPIATHMSSDFYSGSRMSLVTLAKYIVLRKINTNNMSSKSYAYPLTMLAMFAACVLEDDTRTSANFVKKFVDYNLSNLLSGKMTGLEAEGDEEPEFEDSEEESEPDDESAAEEETPEESPEEDEDDESEEPTETNTEEDTPGSDEEDDSSMEIKWDSDIVLTLSSEESGIDEFMDRRVLKTTIRKILDNPPEYLPAESLALLHEWYYRWVNLFRPDVTRQLLNLINPIGEK